MSNFDRGLVAEARFTGMPSERTGALSVVPLMVPFQGASFLEEGEEALDDRDVPDTREVSDADRMVAVLWGKSKEKAGGRKNLLLSHLDAVLAAGLTWHEPIASKFRWRHDKAGETCSGRWWSGSPVNWAMAGLARSRRCSYLHAPFSCI